MCSMTTRREFLQQTAGVFTGAMMLGSTTTPSIFADGKHGDVTDAPLPVVDTHQHLWDLTEFELPWLKNDAVGPLRRSFLMEDYQKATRGLNVVKTVYMEVNVHPSQHVKEAEHVIELCCRDDNPMVAAVIGGFPHEKGFAAYAERFARSEHVKGFRTVLHDADRPRGLCLQARFMQSMKLLGELNLSFDLCMRPGEVGDGAKLAEKCPKTRFIIDHCGNMPVTSTDRRLRELWKEGMKAAAALPNTVCKISGIVVTAEKDAWKPADLAPVIEHCLETFGEDRIFFGGDWPVCTLRASFGRWVEALRRIVHDRPASFRRKLFHDNAVKFYGIG